jgi:hypothetical protein
MWWVEEEIFYGLFGYVLLKFKGVFTSRKVGKKLL